MPSIDYRKISATGYQAFMQVHRYIGSCGLEPTLVHMVYLRISQINGCAYCVDLHWRDAVECGTDPRKLNLLPVWRETSAFSAREQAALAWAEELTKMADTHPSAATEAAAKTAFSDKEFVDLGFAIALMNGLNRIGVGFHGRPDYAG